MTLNDVKNVTTTDARYLCGSWASCWWGMWQRDGRTARSIAYM